jgi:hypothetical protein
MRINAFHGVRHDAVLAGLESFWARHGRRLNTVPADDPASVDSYELHAMRDGWTLLNWTMGWEWDLRRQAQLHVSRALDCAGILVFVYDGDDWGYELFHHGEAVDHFVQDPQPGNTWFPGQSLAGQPEVLVAQFPGLALKPAQMAPYLVQRPEDWDLAEEWDVPAAPGDEFSRGDELAALAFVRRLGISLNVRGRITWGAPVWRRFTVDESP